MKVQELTELLSRLNPEAEIKIGGWKETNQVARFNWDSDALEEKHITFSHDVNNKLTLHLEFDV